MDPVIPGTHLPGKGWKEVPTSIIKLQMQTVPETRIQERTRVLKRENGLKLALGLSQEGGGGQT